MRSVFESYEPADKLKQQVLVPFALASIFLFTLSVVGIYQEEEEHIKADFHSNIAAIKNSYSGLIHNSVNKLSLALSVVLNNKQIEDAFRKKDKARLLAIAQPVFKELHADYSITHLYFHDEQRMNYLRVHQPERYGDVIDRFSTVKAEESGQLAWGVELGPLGTFTVRVVMPLWDGEKRIGYIELGEEIEKETRELALMFQIKLALLVSKEFLKKEGWEAGTRMMGRKSEWKQLDHSVISFVAPHDFPITLVNNALLTSFLDTESSRIEVATENHLYQSALIPVTDAEDRHVGDLLILQDFTARSHGLWNTVLSLSVVALVIGTILLLLFYFVLGRAEQQLVRRQQKMVAATQAKLEIQETHVLEMEHRSLHNTLTGLPNRKNLNEQFDRRIKNAEEGKQGYVLMLMDIDRMREINDTLGHDVGDRVLQEVAQRLKDGLTDAEIVACVGGNEFAVLLPAPPPELMGISVDRVKQLFSIPITVDGIALPIEMTIGVALFPEHGNESLVLVRHADVAMRKAKVLNKGCEIYDSSLDDYSVRRLTLVGELRHAIETDGLMVYYQPQINAKSGLLEGVEALARWNHVEQGFIGPDEFIPLAERTGLIGPLTHWVMAEALRQGAAWMQEGLDIKISINISAHNLMDLSLPSKVAELLKINKLAPEKLVLEVTESVFMLDPESSLIVLNELKSLGIALSIDDYGTGYSSLAYLKKMPVHELKIDQSFIFEMLGSENDAMIVSSTVALAHALGLSVVAEGVETEEAWKYLQELGCDTIQGYFVSAPLPAETFMEWIDKSTAYDPRIQTS